MCEKGTCVSSFSRQRDSLLKKAFKNFANPELNRRRKKIKSAKAFVATA